MVVGRLAPSPTGAQHLGNARTYLIAWLAARSQKGKVILRIEDIDSPRIKPWAISQALTDLAWLGIDWDEGPDKPGPQSPYLQTERLDRYRQGLLALQQCERVYPCTCTRTDIEQAASAPHRLEGETAWIDGPVYPGNCSQRSAAEASHLNEVNFAWRFRCDCGVMRWEDGFYGPQALNAGEQLGDFVVGKKDGWPAYQLAVVMDDHDMQVSMVVRGHDLIPSTYRQQMLYQFFGWQPPHFYHVPLVVGTDGRRLAKRHGDTRLSTYRDRQIPATHLVGWLAWSCGWIAEFRPITAEELIPLFSWATIPKFNLVVPTDFVDFCHERPRFESNPH
jgi:glutamyl-tRNA synthetase